MAEVNWAELEARGEAQLQSERALRKAATVNAELANMHTLIDGLAKRLAAVEVELAWFRHGGETPPEYVTTTTGRVEFSHE